MLGKFSCSNWSSVVRQFSMSDVLVLFATGLIMCSNAARRCCTQLLSFCESGGLPLEEERLAFVSDCRAAMPSHTSKRSAVVSLSASEGYRLICIII